MLAFCGDMGLDIVIVISSVLFSCAACVKIRLLDPARLIFDILR